MNQAPTQAVVAVRTSSAARRNHLDHESLMQSDELLRQLTELVDGLVNLSAPFKYASSASNPADGRIAPRYSEKPEGDTASSGKFTISHPMLQPQAR